MSPSSNSATAGISCEVPSIGRRSQDEAAEDSRIVPSEAGSAAGKVWKVCTRSDTAGSEASFAGVMFWST